MARVERVIICSHFSPGTIITVRPHVKITGGYMVEKVKAFNAEQKCF